MPWQTGILGLSGTVGDWTYCKNGVVRRRRRSDKEHFQSAPSLAPTRENASEFGRTSAVASLLYRTLHAPLKEFKGTELWNRLMSDLRIILGLDTTHPHGQRELLPAHLPALVGFQFNPTAPLPLELIGTGALTVGPDGALTFGLPAWAPRRFPTGATHYQLTLDLVLLDLTATTARLVAPAAALPPVERRAVDPPATSITVAPDPAPGPAETLLAVLGLRYQQLVNGQLCPLQSRGATSLAIAYVGPPAG